MRSIKLYTLIICLINSLFFLGSPGQAVDYSRFDETARFFAGKSIAEDSKLYAFTKSKQYTSYAESINNGWDKFQKPNLDKITKWWQKFKPAKPYGTVYYPFSGPDIMNALTLFPDADTYIMFGLEPPGKTPNPYNMNRAQLQSGLYGLKKSISFILRINFFRTLDMEKDLGKQSFNSITGVLMFFLAVNNYEIVNVKRIAIDKNSELVRWKESDELIKWNYPSNQQRVPGIEIAFRKNGRLQTVRYFNLNVANEALQESSPNFIVYMQKQMPYNTVLKAASYLLHSKHFSIIRQTVADSDFIVQDDSGMPLKFLPESAWKVKVHGYYWRPIDLFHNCYQKDLREMMTKRSTGILPFSYGYNFQLGKSNLITAEKIK